MYRIIQAWGGDYSGAHMVRVCPATCMAAVHVPPLAEGQQGACSNLCMHAGTLGVHIAPCCARLHLPQPSCLYYILAIFTSISVCECDREKRMREFVSVEVIPCWETYQGITWRKAANLWLPVKGGQFASPSLLVEKGDLHIVAMRFMHFAMRSGWSLLMCAVPMWAFFVPQVVCSQISSQ
jgi:hypothetical protein